MIVDRYAMGDRDHLALRMLSCQIPRVVNNATANAHVSPNQSTDVLSTLSVICEDAEVIEIRVLPDTGTMRVKRFTHPTDAAGWVESFPAAKAIYVVMNPFNESRISGSAVDDGAVTKRKWMLVDCDPKRPPNTNATEVEHALAFAKARAIKQRLADDRWEEPVEADSGNGAHLLYAIDLPNDAESLKLIDDILSYLAETFTDDDVEIDTTVSNASRITKLYGTMTRKGPHSPERPQRISAITRLPDPLVAVNQAALEAVAKRRNPSREAKQESTEASSKYDVRAILAKLHVYRSFVKHGTTYYEIQCFWRSEHTTHNHGTDGAVFTVGADGAIGFRCQHAHCAQRRWPDLREALGIEPITNRRVELVRASEITVMKIVWLWLARLARGAITLLEGGPERGKSTILADLAARVSRPLQEQPDSPQLTDRADV